MGEGAGSGLGQGAWGTGAGSGGGTQIPSLLESVLRAGPSGRAQRALSDRRPQNSHPTSPGALTLHTTFVGTPVGTEGGTSSPQYTVVLEGVPGQPSLGPEHSFPEPQCRAVVLCGDSLCSSSVLLVSSLPSVLPHSPHPGLRARAS